MFARVQTIHEPAEKLDALTTIARDELPGAHQFPGFRGFYYLVDRENEKAVVISLWETRKDLRQLEGHAAPRERAEAQTGIKSPPAEIFEVVLQAS
jgi:heme-degrading monooxygenase HmoA